MVAGLFGRDPWRTDDAAGFGIALTMFTGTSIDWLVPNIEGVLVAATRETNALPGDTRAPAASAILIRPPAKPSPFDPKKNWFRARGEGTAHLPWWSRRHDAAADRMQGWSD